MGSLDTCCQILQQYATPDTAWPPVAKQHFEGLASDPNTLFIPVECGQWLESAGDDFAGQPARSVMLVTPVNLQGEFQLHIRALKLDKDGWPTREAFGSPSAFEALTTRDMRQYHTAARVLLPPAASVTASSTEGAASSLEVTSADSATRHPSAAAAAPNETAATASIPHRGQQQLPALRVWLKHFYGTELKRVASYRRAAAVSENSPSSSAISSRRRPCEGSVVREVEPLRSSVGQWPVRTHTQNWDALARLGQAAIAAADYKGMFDFANSINMQQLQQACDAEVASNCRAPKACRVYDLLLEAHARMQAAVAETGQLLYPFGEGDELAWVRDPVGHWPARHPESSFEGFTTDPIPPSH